LSEGSLSERLAALSRGELVALASVIVVTIAGAGLWYARSLPTPVQIRAQPISVDASVGATGTTASPTGAPILVDVAGWVRRPGVYTFVEGDRVIDAIEAAGGARNGASFSSLNLAAPLADGSQILVPKEAEAAVPVGPTGAPPGAPPALININTATAAELETLSGIGEVIAQAIIDHRTEHGPFTSVDALLDVSGIGDATLEEIRDAVTV
jgi:competence protein ComEA